MADSIREQIRKDLEKRNKDADRKSAFDVADEQAARARARDDNTVNNSNTRARGTAPIISKGGQPVDDIVTEAETGKKPARPPRRKKRR